MTENLPRAKQQGAESAEQHKRRHNDAKAHTGNQVYSCGSLAPKLKKGGCSDCEVCVYMMTCCRVECTMEWRLVQAQCERSVSSDGV